MEYTKQWLSLDEQIDKLLSRGVDIPDRAECRGALEMAGYYRLTGYLYPFRSTETTTDADGRERIEILNTYRPGTCLSDAVSLMKFDRELRLLVLDAMERIELSLRMQLAYQIGRHGPFAHLSPDNFMPAFTAPSPQDSAEPGPSQHDEWLARIDERRTGSKEAFVAHFREKYQDQMPIWALTEIMELGHIGRLYNGLNTPIAGVIADFYEVPSKRLLSSWIAAVTYVRNVAAHHARLFNRKLVTAPSRPKQGQVPLLDHLRDAGNAKQTYGVYNALAVMAYLLRAADLAEDWPSRIVDLVSTFPASSRIDAGVLGTPTGNWQQLELWTSSARP